MRSNHRAVGVGLTVVLLFGAIVTSPGSAEARRRLTLVEDGRGLLHSYSATMGLTFDRSGDYNLWSNGNDVQVGAVGFRYYERNGFITGTLFAIIRMLGAAMAASGPKSYSSWTEGNYRYTRTTYYSQAEKDAMARSASNDAARAFSRPGQSFDLIVYSRNLGGDTSGYRLNMMMGGIKVGGRGARARGMVDFGFGFGKTTSAAANDKAEVITWWRYMGIPIRYTHSVGPVNIYGLWEWNWYGHSRGNDIKGETFGTKGMQASIAGMPLKVGVTTTLFRRLYLEAAASTPHLTSGVFGFSASAGARF